jgi:predicted permease
MAGFWSRWRAAVRNSRVALDEEMRFHIEEAIAAKVEAGMEPPEARRVVMVEFGGLEGMREETYRMRPGWLAERFLEDVRYALRGFRRSPAFAGTVVMTLALGIGATTAVFSVVDRILFRALPYAEDDRLVSVGLVQPLEKQEFMLGSFFFDWKAQQKPFTEMVGQGTNAHACSLVRGGDAVQLNCIAMQQGFLPMLGIQPILGRNFLPEEDRPGGPAVAVLSYGCWKERFGADAGILNRLIEIDGEAMRVVGVLPKSFEMPTMQDVDVVVPVALAPAGQQHGLNHGIGQPMRVFARLKPGVTVEQAREQMQPLFVEVRDRLIPPPMRDGFRLSVRSMRERQMQDAGRMAWVMLGSVAAVLLIACANVASLMSARGVARRREMAVRAALGASRGRMIGQTVTESLLLSLIGGLCGLALAEGLVRMFVALAPTSVPYLDRVAVDLRIAAFALGLAVVCGMLLGLVPMIERTQELTARGTKTRRQARMRRVMVAGQIAVSMMLLAGAALLVESFRNLEEQKLGMDTGGVLTVRLSLAGVRDAAVGGLVSKPGSTPVRLVSLYARAEEAVRRLPGVRAVGWSDSVPPAGGDGRRLSDFSVGGQTVPGGDGVVSFRGVTPDYFRALGIPIVHGRGFTEAERESKQGGLVLSRRAAQLFFGDADPVGRQVRMGSDGMSMTVAGVAENVRNGGLSEPDVPEVYWLRRNVADDWGAPVPMMVVSSDLSLGALAPWIRARMAAVAPGAPVKIETLSEQISKLADRPRFVTSLLSFFAVVGVVMAVIGLYGVTAFLAVERTREIGVRMALGATRVAILRLVAREGIALIAVGGTAGVIGALCVTRLLGSLLFGVGPRDAGSLAVAAGMLGVTALAATMIPAGRAMRVDPVEALRQE